MSYNKFNKARSQNTGNQNNFFNCHLNAVGYLNSLQEMEGPKGKFMVANFCALEGRSDDPTHRYFNLTLTEKMADLLVGFWDEINGEQKCFANLRIGNMEFTPFVYPQNHRLAGQMGVNCSGRLLSIQSLSIDKQKVDLEQFAPVAPPPYQKPQQQNARNHAPAPQGQGYRPNEEYFDETSEQWSDAPAPAYPAPTQQPRQTAPNPSRVPAQNGYQRQPPAQAPRNGAQQRGHAGPQRSH